MLFKEKAELTPSHYKTYANDNQKYWPKYVPYARRDKAEIFKKKDCSDYN